MLQEVPIFFILFWVERLVVFFSGWKDIYIYIYIYKTMSLARETKALPHEGTQSLSYHYAAKPQHHEGKLVKCGAQEVTRELK